MKRNQQEVIDRILDLLTEIVDDAPANPQTKTPPMEMLTIKKCTEAVRGISEHAAVFLLHWNVLFTLAVALIVMILFDSEKIQTAPSLILLGILISLAHFGDWSYLIPAWTIIFFCYYKRDTTKMIVLFVLASVTLQTLLYLKEFDSFALFSFQYGTLFSLIPITMYNGQRGNDRHKNLNRWFFYVYYPAHMALLLVIRTFFT